MSTGVAPHKVTQLENRALQAENENLRNKLAAVATKYAQALLTLEQHRTSMALIVAACGNRVELKPELLDQIDIGRYELKTEQLEETGALVIMLVERPAVEEQPNEEATPATARPTLTIVPR